MCHNEWLNANDCIIGVQVEMLAPAPLRCPISLDCPPVCPQITPCGHVFSFHAILQHLVSASGSEGTTPRAAVKCPLCYTQFSCRELRLVRVLLVQPLQVRPLLSAFTFTL